MSEDGTQYLTSLHKPHQQRGEGRNDIRRTTSLQSCHNMGLLPLRSPSMKFNALVHRFPIQKLIPVFLQMLHVLFKLLLGQSHDPLSTREHEKNAYSTKLYVILCLQIILPLLISLPITVMCRWVKWCNNLLISLLTSDTTSAVVKQKSLSAKPRWTARTWKPPPQLVSLYH